MSETGLDMKISEHAPELSRDALMLFLHHLPGKRVGKKMTDLFNYGYTKTM